MILKELKLVLSVLHEERQALATKVATKEEERSVPCSVYYDFDSGFRYIVSDDPGAGVLEREALSAEERQLRINDKRIAADPDMVVEWNNALDEVDYAFGQSDVAQVTNFDLEAEKAAAVTDDVFFEGIDHLGEPEPVTDQELLDGINSLDEISIEEDNDGMPDDEDAVIDGEIVDDENLELYYYAKSIISNNLVSLRFDYVECTPSQLSGVALLDVNTEDMDPKLLDYNEDENLLKAYRAQLDVIDNYDYDQPPDDDEISDE